MSVLTSEAWSARIPHADSMALIDAVVDWNATVIHAIGERHALSEHPLRYSAGLHAVHLVEYGAQAAAVHTALLGDADVHGGRLVSLRDVQWKIEYVDLSRGRLDVHAERLSANARAAQYAFRVEQQEQQLVSGRVTITYAT